MDTSKALYIWERFSGFEAVQTPLGEFYGRDCIYLDEFVHDLAKRSVSLRGEVNGHLCRPHRPEQWIAYSVQFRGVVACEHTDIDLCTRYNSCFDRVLGSAWLSSFGEGILQTHTHFVFHTYDDVYDILAEDFEFHVPTKNI